MIIALVLKIIKCVFKYFEQYILLSIHSLHYRSPRRREKKRSPTPKPTKVHVGRLTRNVNKEHIHEIFSVYGTIKNLEMPSDRVHPHVSRGYAYVDYDKPEEAEKAVKHMDGGKSMGLLSHIFERKIVIIFLSISLNMRFGC